MCAAKKRYRFIGRQKELKECREKKKEGEKDGNTQNDAAMRECQRGGECQRGERTSEERRGGDGRQQQNREKSSKAKTIKVEGRDEKEGGKWRDGGGRANTVRERANERMYTGGEREQETGGRGQRKA